MPDQGTLDEEGINLDNWTQRSKRIGALAAKNEQVEKMNREKLNRGQHRNREDLQRFVAEEEGSGAVEAHDEELRRRENAALQAAIDKSRAASAKARSSYLQMWKEEPQQSKEHKLLREPGLVPSGRDASMAPALPGKADGIHTFEQLCTAPPASTQPLVYVVDNFLSDSECDHLIALGERRERQIRKMRPLLQAMSEGKIDDSLQPGHMIEWKPQAVPDPLARDVEERIGRLMGAPPHPNDGGIKLAQTLQVAGVEGAEDGEPLSRVPEGCHLDTNRHEHRWGTCIIYLATLDKIDGGETCFPLAAPPDANGGDSTSTSSKTAAACTSARACGARASLASDAALLERAGILHTENAVGDGRRPITEAAARLLEASERTARGEPGAGLAVRPRKGMACVFYTRLADGQVDPSSFHFGAAVRCPAATKWTCQIFKALPTEARGSASDTRAFMQAVHPLAAAPLAPPSAPRAEAPAGERAAAGASVELS